MNIVTEVGELRTELNNWRGGASVALVPTMGNLHEGHLTLVREARRRADRVVVSVFVNPLQFGAGEDFDAYPRTLEDDALKLVGEGVDMLFAPGVDVMYPRDDGHQTLVQVPGISDQFCGASRPGHFTGVATVVCKLFNLTQPDVAVFGSKDFQQLLVIRRMVEDLSMPISIHGVDTVREPDGLAMSSRNGYLTPEERELAPGLYRSLRGLAELLRAGDLPLATLERDAMAELAELGFAPEYLRVVCARDLEEPRSSDKDLVILAAARLGKTRLIDNLTVRL